MESRRNQFYRSRTPHIMDIAGGFPSLDSITNGSIGITRSFKSNNIRLPQLLPVSPSYKNIGDGPSRPAMMSTMLDWDSVNYPLLADKLRNTPKSIWQKVIKGFDVSLWTHVDLFLDRARFFFENYNPVPNHPTPEQLLINQFDYGPDYVERWEKTCHFRRFEALGGVPQELLESDILLDNPSSWNGTDSVLQARWFLFFKIEPVDYEYMFIQPASHDESYLRSLYLSAYEIVQDLVKRFGTPPLDAIGALYTPGPNKGWDYGKKTKSAWKIDHTQPQFDGFARHLVGTRAIAPKKPGEVRDCIVPPTDVKRTYRRLAAPMSFLLKRSHATVYGKDMDHLNSRMDYLYGFPIAYQRDWTKAGLTIPHPVIKVINQAFFDACGFDELAELAESFYDSPIIYINGEAHITKRGHFLGYWTEGCTFLQLAIHRMIQKMDSSIKTRHDAVNDDMVVTFKTQSDAEKYQILDADINDHLSLVIKPKKTFITDKGILYCEEVRGHDNSKDSLYSLAILGAKYAVNVVHAKDYVNAVVSGYRLTQPIKSAVFQVYNSFSPEFDIQEINFPYLFGGWITPYDEGLDCTLDYYNSRMDKCYYAVSNAPSIKINKISSVPTTSLGRVLGLNVQDTDVPYHIRDLIDMRRTNGDTITLSEYYHESQSSWSGVRDYYKRLFKTRKRLFESRLKTAYSPISDWYKRHPAHKIVREYYPYALESKGAWPVRQWRSWSSEREYDIGLFLAHELNIISLNVETIDRIKEYRSTDIEAARMGIAPSFKALPFEDFPCLYDDRQGIPFYYLKLGDLRPLQLAFRDYGAYPMKHPLSLDNAVGMHLSEHIPASIFTCIDLYKKVLDLSKKYNITLGIDQISKLYNTTATKLGYEDVNGHLISKGQAEEPYPEKEEDFEQSDDSDNLDNSDSIYSEDSDNSISQGSEDSIESISSLGSHQEFVESEFCAEDNISDTEYF